MKILAKGNSMLPTLEDGEIYNLEIGYNIKIGDIVVYNINSLIICHRVVDIIVTRNKTVFLITKGDNCPEVDPYPITLDKVIGKIII